METGKQKAFTLIELLIVVAIIAILAAIAVPNFLEAQVRSKVARVRADVRSLATAQEAYYTDWNSYTLRDLADRRDQLTGWLMLTTPVAYITSIPSDPFGQGRFKGGSGKILDAVYELGSGKAGQQGDFPNNTYEMSSYGPDKIDDTLDTGNFPGHLFTWNEATYPWPQVPANEPAAIAEALSLIYNPTNGTISPGNILRFGGVKPPGAAFDALYSAAPGN
jgi:prepilin-type N-terminal cleavage/methylation domain-containing protein